MIKKNENTKSATAILGVPVLVGLALTLLMLSVGALLTHLGRMDINSVLQFTLVSLAFSGWLTGLQGALRASRSKFLWGLACGGILFACLLLVSILWIGEPIRLTRILLVGGVTLSAAALGSIIGKGKKQQRYKSHERRKIV